MSSDSWSWNCQPRRRGQNPRTGPLLGPPQGGSWECWCLAWEWGIYQRDGRGHPQMGLWGLGSAWWVIIEIIRSNMWQWRFKCWNTSDTSASSEYFVLWVKRKGIWRGIKQMHEMACKVGSAMQQTTVCLIEGIKQRRMDGWTSGNKERQEERKRAKSKMTVRGNRHYSKQKVELQIHRRAKQNRLEQFSSIRKFVRNPKKNPHLCGTVARDNQTTDAAFGCF